MKRMKLRLLALILMGSAALPLTAAEASPLTTSPAAGATHPSTDAFYRYAGPRPLRDLAPGTVLKSRPVTLHQAGVPTGVSGQQLLYRTTGERGAPTATVATIYRPTAKVFPEPRLVSVQFAYDALDAKCDPSYMLAGGPPLGGTTYNVPSQAEIAAVLSLLAQGYTVVVSDYEGPDLQWFAGRMSGRATLDGIRAAIRHDPELTTASPVGLVGYSGGGVATQWASQYAATYAPELRIVGAAAGGFVPSIQHMFAYIDGSPLWAGVMPAVLQGVARGYQVSLDPWLSDYGTQVMRAVSSQCVGEFQRDYGGLELADLFKPQYADPFRVPLVAQLNNKQIMGRDGTPDHPVFYRVGNIDGTGDTIIVAADIRQIARTYCNRGVTVDYAELPGLEHLTAAVAFYAQAELWLRSRFQGDQAADNCATIKPGNSLAPLPVTRQRTSLTARHTPLPRVRPDVYITAGRLRLPADSLHQCTGRVTTVLSLDGRTIARASTRLRDDCTYRIRTRLLESRKSSKTRNLRLTVRFPGNAQHDLSSSSQQVRYLARRVHR